MNNTPIQNLRIFTRVFLNNNTVYDYVQQDGAVVGVAWGLVQQEEVSHSF